MLRQESEGEVTQGETGVSTGVTEFTPSVSRGLARGGEPFREEKEAWASIVLLQDPQLLFSSELFP